VAYYANELSINEMKPGDWLVAPYCHLHTTAEIMLRVVLDRIPELFAFAS